jgi:hypothetical protein
MDRNRIRHDIPPRGRAPATLKVGDRTAMARNTVEPEALHRALLRLNARAWGLSIGMLCGGGLFIATNFLLLKGGANVGTHLSLLAVYFPGYRVTVLGSFIGFVYAFVLGYAVGRLIGAIYNRLAGTAA